MVLALRTPSWNYVRIAVVFQVFNQCGSHSHYLCYYVYDYDDDQYDYLFMITHVLAKEQRKSDYTDHKVNGLNSGELGTCR